MKFIYSLLLLLVFSSAYSTEILETKYAKDICEITGVGLPDRICTAKRFKHVEALLNTRYRELLAKLDEVIKQQPIRLANLKRSYIESQRAWVVFREKECSALKVWYTNGNLQDSLYTGCMRTLAEKRIDDFSAFTNHQT